MKTKNKKRNRERVSAFSFALLPQRKRWSLREKGSVKESCRGDGRQTGNRRTWMEVSLCEDEASLAVNLEDLLDGVDIRRRPQVQTQVVLVGCSHYLLHDTERGRKEVEKERGREDGRK